MAKSKLLFFLVPIAIIVLLLIFLPKIIKTKLISPFFQGPDQTEKISAKISPPFILDIANTKTITSLEHIPRYIVYNNNTGKVYYSKGADIRMAAHDVEVGTEADVPVRREGDDLFFG